MPYPAVFEENISREVKSYLLGDENQTLEPRKLKSVGQNPRKNWEKNC